MMKQLEKEARHYLVFFIPPVRLGTYLVVSSN